MLSVVCMRCCSSCGHPSSARALFQFLLSFLSVCGCASIIYFLVIYQKCCSCLFFICLSIKCFMISLMSSLPFIRAFCSSIPIITLRLSALLLFLCDKYIPFIFLLTLFRKNQFNSFTFEVSIFMHHYQAIWSRKNRTIVILLIERFICRNNLLSRMWKDYFAFKTASPEMIVYSPFCYEKLLMAELTKEEGLLFDICSRDAPILVPFRTAFDAIRAKLSFHRI